MKLVTFNIRCDYQQDGMNCFSQRKVLIQEKLKIENPHILCFQEVLPHVALWLLETLTDYHVIGCGRTRELDTEQMSIAYQKKAFQLINMNTFWLSETPYVPGSRYSNQSDCPRTATTVLLQEHSTKALYFIVNTHLDHIGSDARLQGMKQIISYMKEQKEFYEANFLQPVYMCLAGDFNALPDSPEIQLLSEGGFLADVTCTLDGTFHGYGEQNPPEKIDYIAITDNLQCTHQELYTDCRNGIYLSDHYPVCVTLQPVN